MRVVCPSCIAAYEVPDALIGAAPRRLRCARCAEEWTVDAPVPVAVARAPVPDLPFPERAPPEPAAMAMPPLIRVPELRVPDSPFEGKRQDEARAGGGVILAWVLSVVVIAGLAAAAFVWRGQVMAAWPPSERVYAALGLVAR